MGDEEQLPPYSNERLHQSEQLSLAAVNTAVGCARLFVRSTLTMWRATAIEDDALLVTSELITNAVNATGVTGRHPSWTQLSGLNLIHIHILALDKSVVIEVWDVSQEKPAQQQAGLPADDFAESGRGLLLIEELSHRWGSYRAEWGKVVWVELLLPNMRQS